MILRLLPKLSVNFIAFCVSQVLKSYIGFVAAAIPLKMINFLSREGTIGPSGSGIGIGLSKLQSVFLRSNQTVEDSWQNVVSIQQLMAILGSNTVGGAFQPEVIEALDEYMIRN